MVSYIYYYCYDTHNLARAHKSTRRYFMGLRLRTVQLHPFNGHAHYHYHDYRHHLHLFVIFFFFFALTFEGHHEITHMNPVLHNNCHINHTKKKIWLSIEIFSITLEITKKIVLNSCVAKRKKIISWRQVNGLNK